MDTPYERPMGDPERHLPMDQIEQGFAALPAPPTTRGRLRAIVRRCPDGRRELPGEATLSVEEGLPGDRWVKGEEGTLNQLTLMRHDLGELLANGQSLGLFGDNLIAELDLSEAALPPGARLRVGEALLELTPEPHNGCKHYKQRFGADALRFISAKERRSLRLRGVHLCVVEGGVVRVGDWVEVV